MRFSWDSKVFSSAFHEILHPFEGSQPLAGGHGAWTSPERAGVARARLALAVPCEEGEPTAAARALGRHITW